MRYSVKREGGVIVATLGPNSSDGKAIRSALSEIVHQIAGADRIVLDMGEVRHLDAIGVGAVLQWLAELRRRTSAVCLCARDRSLLVLLELVRAHQLVEIFDAPEAAIARVNRAHPLPDAGQLETDMVLGRFVTTTGMVASTAE